MFECSACTLRCIRAIAGESLAASRPHQRLLLTPRLTLPSQRRRASTAVATNSTSNGGEPYLNAAQLRHQNLDKSDELAQEAKPDKEKSEYHISTATKKALTKELQFLPDPAKLAEHVHYTLRCEDLHKALNLVRMASREKNCVVAWNHIVNWHMQRGKVNEAIKVFNEMKKRQQFPDSYTYILLLRGLVGRQEKGMKTEVSEENAVKAVSIYTSMTSPTSRVQPSIMHTNAALKVCTFAHDMDAFWGIASKIPDYGAGAADCITYSIILTAIRHGVRASGTKQVERGEAADPQMLEGRRRAIEEGKRVWQEVVQKWRAGQVKIDEELVCAMARVLFLSDRLQDWDNVLDLVQQTTNIERLIPQAGSPERNSEHVPGQATEREPDALDAPAEIGPEDQEEYESFKDTPTAKTFNAVKPLPPNPSKPAQPTTLAYVHPGNDTLSVLLEACTLMRTPKTASAYWDLLTTQHGLKPDLRNFHAQLRLLIKNRASAKAAHLLKEGLKASDVPPRPVTFRLAMSVCQRDNKNDHVVENATVIIDVMEATLSDLDVPTLTQYLGLALATDSGPKIVSVLDRLDSIVHNLRSRILYGTDSKKLSPEGHRADKDDTIHFFRVMVGAVDTLMNRGMVGRETFQHWHARRSQLNTFVNRAMGGKVRRGGKVGVWPEVQALRAQKEEEQEDMGREREAGGGGRRRGAAGVWAGKVGTARSPRTAENKVGTPEWRSEKRSERDAFTTKSEALSRARADESQQLVRAIVRKEDVGPLTGRTFTKHAAAAPRVGNRVRTPDGWRELVRFRRRGYEEDEGRHEGEEGRGWGTSSGRRRAEEGGRGDGAYGGESGFADSPAELGM